MMLLIQAVNCKTKVNKNHSVNQAVKTSLHVVKKYERLFNPAHFRCFGRLFKIVQP